MRSNPVVFSVMTKILGTGPWSLCCPCWPAASSTPWQEFMTSWPSGQKFLLTSWCPTQAMMWSSSLPGSPSLSPSWPSTPSCSSWGGWWCRISGGGAAAGHVGPGPWPSPRDHGSDTANRPVGHRNARPGPVAARPRRDHRHHRRRQLLLYLPRSVSHLCHQCGAHRTPS